MLDPFVQLLSSSLSSPHPKVLSRALQGLTWVLRLPLPSLDAAHQEGVAQQLFGILRKYARTGLGTGSNRELVLSAFKVRSWLTCFLFL